MTDGAHRFDREKSSTQASFDLVEDLGGASASDQEAFDRALSALVPQEGGSRTADGPGVDIDLDDFEAFNRELDARLAEARAHPADEEPIEDLGAEIIHPAAPMPAAAPERSAAAPRDLPDLADDVVTLGHVGAASGAAPPPPTPPVAATKDAPRMANAAPPPVASMSSRIALALGAAGLLAGGAGLWLNQAREADLARLESAMARSAAAVRPPAVAAPTPEYSGLDSRFADLGRQVESLSAAVNDASASSTRALHVVEDRLARTEAELAALRAIEHAAPAAKAPPGPQVEPPAVAVKEASKTPAKTESPAAKKAPAKEPARQSPNPVADPGATAPTSPPATESAKEAATAVAEAPESAPAQDKSVAATATAAAPKAKKALPKAGGGSWAVVVESFAAEPEAYRRLNRVEGAGFVADVVPAQINGQTWHRVIVGGYASQDDAKTVATDLRGRGLGQAWVMQRKAE